MPFRSAARIPAPDYGTALLARRLHAVAREANEILWLKGAGDGDIFADGLPMNADAPSNEYPLLAMRRGRFEKPRKPCEGNGDRSTVGYIHVKRVGRTGDLHRQGLTLFR